MTAPTSPNACTRLPELATDLWWTWNPQAREVFRKLDYPLWRQTAHNPVLMLRQRLAGDAGARGAGRAVPRRLRRGDRGARRARAARATRGGSTASRTPQGRSPTSPPSSRCTSRCRSTPAASACSPAITARKRATSAFRSSASGSCIRRATSTRASRRKAGSRNSTSASTGTNAPIEPAITADGKPCIVAVPLGNRSVLVSVWRVRLGRVKLYLLDTDLEENAPWDRELSARLYGGDRETRIQQEIILGIGGVRALKALGLGAGGLAPQRRPRGVRRAAAHPRSASSSGDVVRGGARGSAAHDDVHDAHAGARPGTTRFRSAWSRRTSPDAWGTLGAYRDALPGARPLRQRQRAAVQHDGAGAAHRRRRQRRQPAARRGHARDVGADLAGRRRTTQRPVRAITNGVHVPTWLSSEMARLFDDHLAGRLARSPRRSRRCGRACSTSRTRSCGPRGSALRNYLFAFIRERARQRWKEEHVSAARVVAAGTLLDPNALTIGFARRFTGYKRPELIFHNPERLLAILNASRRPVQIVFAGKAHPADETGKHHLQQVYRRAIDPDVRRPHRVRRRLRPARRALPRAGLRRVAEQPAQAARGQRHERHEGVDQRRAAPQHRRRLVGRRLHRRQRLADRRPAQAADHDAQSTPPTPRRSTTCSRREIVPTFYDRDANGIPRRWLSVVRQAIVTRHAALQRAPHGQGVRRRDVRRRRCAAASRLPLSR